MVTEVDGLLTAARELKAPLTTLRQLALSVSGADADVKRVQAQMVSVSERALRQVDDLERLERLEDGLFEMEPVAVRVVCDAVAQELEHLFRYNGRKLKIKYSKRLPLATANRELLYSVVYNFLLDAMHYATSGERAELMVRDARGRVRIEVRDFGPALPMGVWREMKRGWMEQPVSIAMRPGSSGLGLFIASRFSRYMNGKVGAVRHRDGTSFYVELMESRQMSLFGG